MITKAQIEELKLDAAAVIDLMVAANKAQRRYRRTRSVEDGTAFSIASIQAHRAWKNIEDTFLEDIHGS